MKVAVLMGGNSAEREVSLQTGGAVAEALRKLGHHVSEIDAARRDLPAVLEDDGRPDAVFLALHGRGGEDGTVQGLLEVMRIPYTGSGILASAVTMDKIFTKRLIEHGGIPVPEDLIFTRGYDAGTAPDIVAETLSYPVMVKPASEGSSIAVSQVTGPGQLVRALDEALEYDRRVLVEEFISGRNLTVGILGEEPVVLPVLEIIPLEGFYDYRAKYEKGRSEYEVPASLTTDQTRRAQEFSLRCFEMLDCASIARVDLILQQGTGEFFVLEVNTIPGMTETSLVPKAAAAAGMSFVEVVDAILSGAGLKTEIQDGGEP